MLLILDSLARATTNKIVVFLEVKTQSSTMLEKFCVAKFSVNSRDRGTFE